MSAFQFEVYIPEYFDDVKMLWEDAFPDDPAWNKAEVAIPPKMALQPELFLVARGQGRVIGSVMAGYDGHRGWLYAVAVLSSDRRQGIGKALIHEAEIRLYALGCRKINLQIRTSNATVIEFYQRLGYFTEERVSMGKRLSS